MERHLIQNLRKWKEKKNRKPLLLYGARQVGKTWLLQEFGRNDFENTAYVNFDGDNQLCRLFQEGYDIQRLLNAMQIRSGQPIIRGRTLLIMDEIQECPRALTSLKYFCEQMPDLPVAAAGSLLGVTIHEGTGFPVGKVQTLNLYPLSFREFLNAVDAPTLSALTESDDIKLLQAFSSDLISHLRNYYFVGGMPAAVQSFADNRNYAEVREIQKDILNGYEADISKHIRLPELENVLAAWNSIPMHLSQENKRFIFGHIREGARAHQYSSGLTWLARAGLILKVPRVKKPVYPLGAYADEQVFKAFMTDIGLLGAMAGLRAESLLGDTIFEEFKGALTEQYVAQQLLSEREVRPFYWKAENARAEVDFVIQEEGEIIGIEVKAAENLRSKSLRAFHEKFPYTEAIRLSMSGYRKQDWMTNIPLYAMMNEMLWPDAGQKHQIRK